jgi:hypothetical protein
MSATPPSDFYDSQGNKVKHVDDGSNATYQQTGTGVDKHYEFKGFDEKQGGINKVNITTAIQEAQNLNASNSSLEPNDATYCNYGTQNVLKVVVSATNNSESLNISGMANSMTDQFPHVAALHSGTQSDATTAGAQGNLALFGYHNTNPAPHNHGHVGTFSVGENIQQGAVANIGAHNGFLPVGPGKGAVFSQQKTLDNVHFYIMNSTVTPKTASQIIHYF